MASIAIRGKVVYAGVGPTGVGVPMRDATVRVYDFDQGGNGNDLLFTGLTNENGDFSGNSPEWIDANVAKVTLPGHWEDVTVTLPGGRTTTRRVWRLDGSHEATAEVPDALILMVQVEHRGQTWGPVPFSMVSAPLPPAIVPVPWAPPVICLPQDDPMPSFRTERREHIAGQYQWRQMSHPPVSHCHGIPLEEVTPPDYVARRTVVGTAIVANTASVRALHLIDAFDSVDDYKKLFPALGVPQIAETFSSDASFALQRVAGVHPLMIRRVTALPADFPVKDAAVAPLLAQGDSLGAALAGSRLFMVDYGILDGIPVGSKRYLPAPYALFYRRDPTDPALVPIAIQIERRHHPEENPIITPTSASRQPVRPRPLFPFDGSRVGSIASTWTVAKMMVQIADLNAHELNSHLFGIHIAMEPFVVASGRAFDRNHPLKILLRRHFFNHIANMFLGREQLINVGGFTDRLLGGTHDGQMQIVKRAKEQWTFDGAGLEKDLAARGVDTVADLPHYPYRDDARSVHGIIDRFVDDYVRLYYVNDSAVTLDTELQAWLAEVRDPAKGNLPNVPDVRNRSSLVRLVSQLIFTCSAQHAALNFSQYEFMAFSPNMPGASWGNPMPSSRGGNSERDMRRLLPPKDQALEQVELTAQLGLFRYDALGHYAPFIDPRAEAAAIRFRLELGQAELQIRDRDRSRPLKYPWLYPSNIPNSASV